MASKNNTAPAAPVNWADEEDESDNDSVTANTDGAETGSVVQPYSGPKQGNEAHHLNGSSGAAAAVTSADTATNLGTLNETGGGGAAAGSGGHGSHQQYTNILEYDPSNLPDYACMYCGYHADPSCCVRCLVCGRWFCNSKGLMNASHIVTHMFNTKHTEIACHPSSQLGGEPFECLVCEQRNAFNLGFVPSTEDRNMLAQLCRMPCMMSPTVENQYSPKDWEALIEGRQLVEWVARSPSVRELNETKSLQVLMRHATQLESYWTRGVTEMTIKEVLLDTAVHVLAEHGDLEAATDLLVPTQLELPPVPRSFRDGDHYTDIWSALIESEEEESRKSAENVKIRNLDISWERGRVMYGTFAASLEYQRVLRRGSTITVENGNYRCEGYVLSSEISSSVDITVKFEVSSTGADDELNTVSGKQQQRQAAAFHEPPTASGGYLVGMSVSSAPYERMRRAIRDMNLDKTSVSHHLFKTILGQPTDAVVLNVEVPADLSAPNLARLNDSQERAVREALIRPLTLLQGPPGTGKTTTTASLVYHMVRQFQKQVLVGAPSNVAVNELAHRISMTEDLTVLRIVARHQEDIPSAVAHLCLHKQVEEFIKRLPDKEMIKKLYNLKQAVGSLSQKDEHHYRRLISAVESNIINEADVVCVTCSSAGMDKLETLQFQHVVIDEVTQSPECETIIPVVHGTKQLVLVGDHCQLGPTIQSKAAMKAKMDRSLFERLMLTGLKPVRLDVQYRMHPFLSEFSSNTFYEGTLANGVTAAERESSDVFSWPNPQKPMFFYNSRAGEELGATGNSVLNRFEAQLCERFVTHLLKNGVKPESVAVVTPYEAQRSFVTNLLLRQGQLGPEAYRHVEVSSVDGFQGREKEFTIMSCVRSNDSYAVGFVNEWRRLNVALTRARRGMMLVGNAQMLARHTLWHGFLTFCRENQLIVEGSVQDLQPVAVNLGKPRLTANVVEMAATIASGSTSSGANGSHEGGMMMNGASVGAEAPRVYGVTAATDDGFSSRMDDGTASYSSGTSGTIVAEEPTYAPGQRGTYDGVLGGVRYK